MTIKLGKAKRIMLKGDIDGSHTSWWRSDTCAVGKVLKGIGGVTVYLLESNMIDPLLQSTATARITFDRQPSFTKIASHARATSLELSDSV